MAVAVTFNFTDAQVARITAAANAYNAVNGTTFTAKQYALWAIKQDVMRRLLAADTTPQTLAAAITTDLTGEA